MEIVTNNANTMFSEMFWRLKTSGVPVETRNGPALRIAEPVLTRVKYPQQRVLFHAGRDANPVFHCLESIWMLAGRRDVEFVKRFNSRIGQYSDDGKVFNAAYGHRMRKHFGRDQLDEVIRLLRREPGARQAVVQLWDSADISKRTLDRACNMQLIFGIFNVRLNLTVINRSNDAWFGYAGANIVHFTMIQEFVASAVGARLGEYRTFSNNLHLYTQLYDAGQYLAAPPTAEDYDHYSSGRVRPMPLMLNGEYRVFLQECEAFCSDPFNTERAYRNPFLQHVAVPMAMVSRVRNAHAGDGRAYAAKIRAEDWRYAVFDWIGRRERARAERESALA